MSTERVLFSGGPLDGSFQEYPGAVGDELRMPTSDGKECVYVRSPVEVKGCCVFMYSGETDDGPCGPVPNELPSWYKEPR